MTRRSLDEEFLLHRLSKLEAEVERLKKRDIHHSKLIRMLAESLESARAKAGTQRDEPIVVERVLGSADQKRFVEQLRQLASQEQDDEKVADDSEE